MFKTAFASGPRVRPGGQSRVLDLQRAGESPEPAGHGSARRVGGTPDDRVVLVAFALLDRAECRRRFRCRRVADRGHLLIGERRGDERILPRVVARDPAADDRCELAGLQVQTSIVPRREPQRIFVQTRLHVAVGRVEALIHTGLGKAVEPRSQLRIRVERKPRGAQVVPGGVEHAGRRTGEAVGLRVGTAAEPDPDLLLASGKGQRLVEPVDPFLGRRMDRGKQ